MTKPTKTMSIDKFKPFLRWAGGKRWLVKDIDKYLPKEGYNNYLEPFLGGGSIFFHLTPSTAILSDLNFELIETYQVLKENVEGIINELVKFKNTKEFYYDIRNKSFKNDFKRAAQFIYLNQTSFNGIYRVNLKGKYNVPYGYRKKNFLDHENLRTASSLLQNSEIIHRDFIDSIQNVNSGDLVFLDPPYTVAHNNNSFIKYNSKLFDINAQYSLSEYIDAVDKRGAYYILTNAAHHKVKEIFSRSNNTISSISRASLIGGTNAKRGKYDEFIITNISRT